MKYRFNFQLIKSNTKHMCDLMETIALLDMS